MIVLTKGTRQMTFSFQGIEKGSLAKLKNNEPPLWHLNSLLPPRAEPVFFELL